MTAHSAHVLGQWAEAEGHRVLRWKRAACTRATRTRALLSPALQGSCDCCPRSIASLCMHPDTRSSGLAQALGPMVGEQAAEWGATPTPNP